MDRIRNNMIRNKVKVIPVDDKVRETRLRWFGHVKRTENAPLRKCEIINLLKCRRGEV